MLKDLIAKQEESAIEIAKLIATVKKAPLDRRTLDFYQKKSVELTELWKVFEQQDNGIRRHPSMVAEHPYLVQGTYDSTRIKFCEATEEIEQAINSLTGRSADQSEETIPVPISQKPLPAVREPRQDTEPASSAEFKGTIRRQRALIISLERLLQGQSKVEAPVQSVLAIDKLWANIVEMHLTVHELCDDPSTGGYDIAKYLELEGQVLKHKEQLLAGQKCAQTHATTSKSPSIELPKMTIPKFDGDYLKWQTFADIFSKMIHEQPLPAIQKMWYLKANITGDADRLIRHFELTEANYLAAWKTLTDRFNNKRALASALMQKIMNLPCLTAESKAIRDFHDVLNESLAALRNLGIETDKWDPLLIHILIKKLDKQTHIIYEQSLEDPKELQSMDDFLRCLQNRFQSLEAVGGKEKSKVVTTIASSNRTECPLCKTNHPLYYCKQFLTMTPAERLKWVQKKSLCTNCFKADHQAKVCTKGSCTKCSSKHNSLLHLNNKHNFAKQSQGAHQAGTQPAAQFSSSSAAVPSTSSPSTVAAAQSSTAASANQRNERQGSVLLATARIKITAPNGRSGEFRAILDSGSQINIVTERLVKRLSIEPKKASLAIEGIGGRSKNTSQRVNINFESMTTRFSARLEAFVLPSIVPAQPRRSFDISSWPIPKNIQLADPYFNNTGKIDVLLGAEFYFDLMLSEEIRLTNEIPILRNTKLGWIASGWVNDDATNSAICAVYSEDELATSEIIQKFWKIDDFHPDTSLSLAQQKCETHFLQTTIRNAEGRFVVRLPFTDDPNSLAESKGVALSRFLALERRLARDPQLQKQYVDFMKEYEALGHMTRISAEQVQGAHFYIPHHCVLRPDSSTTKLRVVFDASAKTSSGCSLNDILCTGPTIQGDLFGMLLRFRLPKFVFTTDIEKMYRQILVNKEDRQFQLIFWRNAPGERMEQYMLNTVTYGTSSAPYLATKCLQQLAEANKGKYPLGAPALQHDFYVDDGMSGSDSLATAIEMQKQLTKLLQEAGFKLRKWCANHSRLLQGISPEDREVNLDFENTSTKVLGLTWIPKTDQFCLKANVTDSPNITKRSVTSDVARIFDPLGIAGPVVTAAKIFIQKLWQMQISWDHPLPTEMSTQWSSFRHKLNQLNNNRLGRHIFDNQKAVQVQLHVFVDASEKAYGAVLYLRSKLEDGRLIVRLLCAKSRVAPLKGLTLPRLELCAAALGAELTARVKRELRFENIVTFYWSDSEIVLYWINSTSSALRTFVANKISKIQTLTVCNQWRHVSTKDNPADFISRGLSPDRLASCNLWFYGPTFLHDKETVWPQPFIKESHTPTNLEFKQKIAVAAVASSGNMQDIIYKVNHRNSFRTLQRILGYVLRFIKNTRQKKQSRPTHKALTPDELNQALLIIISAIQASDFTPEINQLQKGAEIDKKSSITSLFPFLDDQGVLRVGGRLESSTLQYDAKHPMLIPYNDPLIKLLFETIHKENKHCGPQALLNIMRQRFWPIKGKITARSTVQKCIRCARAKPQLCQQLMGNLPQTRVTPARPFVNTGVDYCGPFWIHYKVRGKRPTKAYLAVFCCFATKAVHLEVVTDLSTEAFIGALKRFIGRRGCCQNIYSDNATNFVGAKNQLTELNDSIYSKEAQESIISASSSKGIQFHFIPPRAPHFGGLWEAAVKSAKHLLLRSVATASLTHEELETVVVEIEAILNSRPLTPMSNDPSDMEALTPGHFLIGEPLTSAVDSRAQPIKVSGLSHWNLVTHIKQEFWKRWSTEYLNELQQRHKWKQPASNMKTGDMVIIKEDNLPALQWPLGRVMNVHKGGDKAVRVVDVKTAKGLFKRPIHRLAPLPVDIESSTSNTIASDSTITKSLPPQSSTSYNIASGSTSSKQIGVTIDEVPPKRRKTSGLSLTAAFLVIMFMMPLVWASEIVNTKFASDVGIHFEGIGHVKTSKTNWNLIVYYELTPYWEEMQAFSNGTSTIRHLCKELRQASTCKGVITALNHIEEGFRLDYSLLPNKRNKRGALNIVGNVANSLFGVLDSEYALEMTNTIEAVKQNENHLFNLLKNQTSILDATINILKQDEKSIKNKFKDLDAQGTEIMSRIHNIEDSGYQSRLFQIFIALAMQLTIAAANLERIRSAIMNVLTDTHHGKISPSLLSPNQLQNEIMKIRNYLPSSVQIPVNNDNHLQLYKLMTVEGGLTESHVIFKISIPLCDQEPFELYRLYPVPLLVNASLIAIKLCNEILAMNAHRDQYFPMDRHMLHSCTLTDTDTYLCSNIQSKYKKGSEICSCEIQLLNNDTRSDCNIERLKTNTSWTQLSNKNKWMYALNSPKRINAVCERQGQQLILEGSGLLTLQPECVIKDDTITIQGHQSFSSNLYESYTSLINLENITKPNHPYPVLHKTYHYNTQSDNLTNLQTMLEQQKGFDMPTQIKNINLHHSIVGYTALILSIALITYTIWKMKSRHYNLQSTTPETPQPIPRERQTTSDFVVSVT